MNTHVNEGQVSTQRPVPLATWSLLLMCRPVGPGAERRAWKPAPQGSGISCLIRFGPNACPVRETIYNMVMTGTAGSGQPEEMEDRDPGNPAAPAANSTLERVRGFWEDEAAAAQFAAQSPIPKDLDLWE